MKPLIRALRDSDKPFIFSTAGAMSKIRAREAKAILDYSLDMAHTYVICADEEPDLLMAFMVVHNRCIVWAYTKSHYRRMGFFRMLMQAHHLNNPEYMIEGIGEWQKILKKKYKARHNPYLLWQT